MMASLPILALALTGVSLAGELYTGPFGEGGTWNLYQRIDQDVAWPDAKRLAEELKAPAGNPELSGHLVTFSSLAENQFMRQVAGRTNSWCGLTDDERFGGQEAGSNPRKGWKWITGEPLTFSNWKPVEPDNWSTAGEDAVAFDRYGSWTDKGNGLAGQVADRAYFVVEWETRSEKPVEGAIPLTKVWLDDVEMPPVVPGKWNAHWASGFTVEDTHNMPKGYSILSHGHSIPQAAQLLLGHAGSGERNESRRTVEKEGYIAGNSPLLWMAIPDNYRQGWLSTSCEVGTNFPGLPTNQGYIGAVTGKIHVEKAGTYTFAISSIEAFALRIGGLKWKSVSGDASIDPLDPLTVTQPYDLIPTKALAVMELPAGDHLVEALWMVGESGCEFNVLSAPGVQVEFGSTTDWRPLGYEKTNAPVPSLGITDAGWTVECSPGSRQQGEPMGLKEGLLKLELDLGRTTKSGLASINFAAEPETDASHFPGAAPFPIENSAPPVGRWPLRAKARLIVPMDGLYQIGLHAAGYGALRIKGAALTGFSQTTQGNKDLNQHEDSFDFDGQANINGEPKIVGEWQLGKGEYDIEVFYVRKDGPTSLAVFSSTNGPYGPSLLAIAGAKLSVDVPGLPHATR